MSSCEGKPNFTAEKNARVVELFATKNNISIKQSLDVFYNSWVYTLMSEGVSNMHCMSDEYLVQELKEETK